MQIHANEKNVLISALQAEKRKDYACPECGSAVRLRAGELRHLHFYHISKSSSCRLAGKGIIHFLLQQYLEVLLGASLEMPFSTICRIADAYVGNTVYEIQYSPMSIEEAKKRTGDYESLGLDIVWILHDHHYNQKSLRPAEHFLRTRTCYYTNFDENGQGWVYDKDPENRVDLTKRWPLPKKRWPYPLDLRGKTWTFYHEGDLFDLALKGHLPKKRAVLPHFKSLYHALLHSLADS